MRFTNCLAICLLFAAHSDKQVCGQVNISSLGGGTYTQNFDNLISSGTNQAWSNNSTLPGWSLFRQPAPGTAITTYNAGDGGSNAGSFYSFGTGSNTDRALGGTASGGTYFGSPASGTVAGWITVGFRNDTEATIPSATILYDGEQWRNGGNTTAQTMAFEYGVGATFETVTTWTAPGSSFDFTSPVTGATAAAVNGNAEGLVQNIGGTLSSLNLEANQTLWFRWIENNDAGNDHGLGIDNFRFTPVPEPGTIFAIGAAVLGGGAFVRRKLGKKADGVSA